MGYKVYGTSVSPFVRKVLVYMAEKGIACDNDPINPFSPPDNYKEISPLGKIPSLIDGDKTLADSSVICMYLERGNPTPAMYPSDDYEYAQCLWIEEFIDGGFVPKAGGNVFFPLVVAPLMMKQPVTDEVRASVDKSIAEEVEPMWDYLEEEIGDKEFYVGGNLSIADIAVASIHVNLYHANVDPDPKRWPQLSAFVRRMHARESFAKIIAEEIPMWSQRDK